MSAPSHSDVLIVGAGLAGLSAAVALSGKGAKVTLLERKPHIGGRAYSYLHPALEEVVDSQHVLLGCCTNLIDLCRLTGADRFIRWYDHISFLEPSTDNRPVRESKLGPGLLPAPGHAALSFLRAPMLGWRDKWTIATGLLEFLRGYPQTDEEAFSEWLQRTGQTERAVRHFWEPVVLATLNDSFERCSTRYAGKVFHEAFLRSGEGGRLGIPVQPLSEFYAAFAAKAVEQGTDLHLRSSVERILSVGKHWQIDSADGRTYTADALLLALPFESTAKLLTGFAETGEQHPALMESLSWFSHAPITTVHLWFDRAVTTLHHAALLDTRIQWMFNKTAIRGGQNANAGAERQYLELTISGSFQELRGGKEAIVTEALRELALFFPEVRRATVLKSGVLKEARATFSVLPDLDRFRPGAAVDDSGLYLAGDWTRTGWPSTMESAVRSGRLAAEAILGRAGHPGAILSPDLAPGVLVRALAWGPERIRSGKSLQ